MVTISKYINGEIKTVNVANPEPGATVSNLAWADQRYKEATDMLREGSTPEAIAHALSIVDGLDEVDDTKTQKPHRAPVVMMRMAAHQFVREALADHFPETQFHGERVQESMQELASIITNTRKPYPWRKEAPDAFLMAFPQVFR